MASKRNPSSVHPSSRRGFFHWFKLPSQGTASKTESLAMIQIALPVGCRRNQRMITTWILPSGLIPSRGLSKDLAEKSLCAFLARVIEQPLGSGIFDDPAFVDEQDAVGR